MSTQINQIIEVRIDGKWKYIPVSNTADEYSECLVEYGSVRDLFAYKYHGAEEYLTAGVPEDISKAAREAMVYGTDDYIASGSCWISWQQYEALVESIRLKFLSKIERLVAAGRDSDVSKRLKRLEEMVAKMSGSDVESEDSTDETGSEAYIREDMEDLMWAWCCAEKNMSEIEAHVDHMTNGDYRPSDIRVIMYVC